MAAASEDTFQIGLALSGAISAGAYTAGVLDYLFQALNAWEQAKKKDPRAPQHHVNLQVVTGASAGAITGALGAIALARGFRPSTAHRRREEQYLPHRHRSHAGHPVRAAVRGRGKTRQRCRSTRCVFRARGRTSTDKLARTA